MSTVSKYAEEELRQWYQVFLARSYGAERAAVAARMATLEQMERWRLVVMRQGEASLATN